MDNQQLSALNGESSTTIPVMGSRDKILNSIPETEQFILSNWRSVSPVSGIYCIVNTINNKVYIGISVNLRKRLKEHFYISKGYKVKGGSKFKNAILKYGIDTFKSYILEYTNTNLIEKESYYIKIFDAIKNGYNIIEYSEKYVQNYKKTDEQIQKHIKQMYDNKICVKETLCYTLSGNFYKSFESRVRAAEYFKYKRRTLNESVENNSKVILENKESFYKCNNYIFIDSKIYDGRIVRYLKHKDRKIIRQNIPNMAIEKSKKTISFININTNEIFNFSSIRDSLKSLLIPHSTYYKYKNNINYIYNSKYMLNNK